MRMGANGLLGMKAKTVPDTTAEMLQLEIVESNAIVATGSVHKS